MSGEVVAALRGVTKTFGTTVALEDCSFEVAAGRIVGLLGPNGAGKTTCIRVLLGLAEPDEGHVEIFGQRGAELPGAARRVGVATDDIGPLPGATGRGDLAIWARALGLPPRRVDDVLERVGLGGNAARRKVSGYSTGMRKRHALACALLADPAFLVLDEPASGLDPDGIRWLRRLLRRLAEDGRTILLSSHQLAEVQQTVDDVVILRRSVRYAGPLDGLMAGGASLEDRYFELTDVAEPLVAP